MMFEKKQPPSAQTAFLPAGIDMDPSTSSTEISEEEQQQQQELEEEEFLSGCFVPYNPKKSQKKVGFSRVNIKEYPIIVGDNPGCSLGGTPITIAWEVLSSTEYDIDVYEESRFGFRRSLRTMKLCPEAREKLLENLGFSSHEIRKGAAEAYTGRSKRRSTTLFMGVSKCEEKLEYVTRNVHNLLSRGKKKQKEREFLLQHVPRYQQ